jgi:hypothetical protein
MRTALDHPSCPRRRTLMRWSCSEGRPAGLYIHILSCVMPSSACRLLSDLNMSSPAIISVTVTLTVQSYRQCHWFPLHSEGTAEGLQQGEKLGFLRVVLGPLFLGYAAYQCSQGFFSTLVCSVLFCSVLFCSVLFCSVLFCSVLFCSVLFCSVLYCTVLFCTVLFCSIVFYRYLLYCSVFYSLLLFVFYCMLFQFIVLHSILLI